MPMVPVLFHPALFTDAFQQWRDAGERCWPYGILDCAKQGLSTGHGCRWPAVSQSPPWQAQKTGCHPTE